jgi:hypothetical protein
MNYQIFVHIYLFHLTIYNSISISIYHLLLVILSLLMFLYLLSFYIMGYIYQIKMLKLY